MQPSKRPSALNKYQYRQQQHQQQYQQQYQQQLPQQEQHQQHQIIRQEQNFRQRQQQNLPRQQHPPPHANPIDASVGRMSPVLAPTPVPRPSTNTTTRKKVPPVATAATDQRRLSMNAISQHQHQRQVQARQFPTKNAMNLPVPSPRPGTALLSTPTNVTSPPRLFDLFFDVPHPGASKESDRARMVEPPEASESSARFLSELYEPSAVSRLARFAFPCHDDHKYAMEVQAKAVSSRRNSSGSRSGLLNRLDVYLIGFRSERHTFSLLLEDGKVKLYGHTLIYLPRHRDAKMRPDVGRRGTRAMILLTRVGGGDAFYTAILKSLESVMIQGDTLTQLNVSNDLAQEKAMRLLHGLHRLHVKLQAETMMNFKRAGKDAQLLDNFLTLPGIEINLRIGGFLKDHCLPGDFIQLRTPPCLQARYPYGVCPDDFDVPVLPLLRCIGATSIIRVISALMCERKVIFVSDNIPRLSSCVRAASSLLAQGNLIWQYNLVPILSPHMLHCIAVDEPYLIGILDEFMGDVEVLKSLTEVLCLHLDKNQFKTFGMEHPSMTIPDVLTKSSRDSVFHVLHNDMQQILKAETRLWRTTEDLGEVADPAPRKKRIQKQEKIEVDMAALFHQAMRGDILSGSAHDRGSEESSAPETADVECARLDRESGHLPRKSVKQNTDHTSLTTFDVCENFRGEEGLRAALTFFFLVTHGDLSILLSQGQTGAFFLDRKKYLLHLKKNGNKESSPLFVLFKRFSGTAMLEQHLSLRIEDFEKGKSNIMSRHMSLFSLCEKHLRLKKMDFAFDSIRKVVSQTTRHSPLHEQVETSELGRARALALTSPQPFEGDVTKALSSLMHDSHDCDSILSQVMAVIWSRLDDRKSGPKTPLLGLHLLKSLITQGPTTAIAYAMDGIDKIRRLRFYDASKTEENNVDVRDAAKTVWVLLTDGTRLFHRRKQILANRAKLFQTNINERWGSYLLRKLPFETDFREYHTLLRPKASTMPAFMMKNRNRALDPKDSFYIGRNIQDLEIMRMSLEPISSVSSSHEPFHAEANLNYVLANELIPVREPKSIPRNSPHVIHESRLTNPTERRQSGFSVPHGEQRPQTTTSNLSRSSQRRSDSRSDNDIRTSQSSDMFLPFRSEAPHQGKTIDSSQISQGKLQQPFNPRRRSTISSTASRGVGSNPLRDSVTRNSVTRNSVTSNNVPRNTMTRNSVTSSTGSTIASNGFEPMRRGSRMNGPGTMANRRSVTQNGSNNVRPTIPLSESQPSKYGTHSREQTEAVSNQLGRINGQTMDDGRRGSSFGNVRQRPPAENSSN